MRMDAGVSHSISRRHPPVHAMSPSSTEPPADPASRLRQRGSNQVGMRQFNERVVLQALRAHGPAPKAALARLTGLTAQTIGLITARLDEDGLLVRQSPVRGRVGQPSVPLGLNPDGAFAIGIKVEGAKDFDPLPDPEGQLREGEILALVGSDLDIAHFLTELGG